MATKLPDLKILGNHINAYRNTEVTILGINCQQALL